MRVRRIVVDGGVERPPSERPLDHGRRRPRAPDLHVRLGDLGALHPCELRARRRGSCRRSDPLRDRERSLPGVVHVHATLTADLRARRMRLPHAVRARVEARRRSLDVSRVHAPRGGSRRASVTLLVGRSPRPFPPAGSSRRRGTPELGARLPLHLQTLHITLHDVEPLVMRPLQARPLFGPSVHRHTPL